MSTIIFWIIFLNQRKLITFSQNLNIRKPNDEKLKNLYNYFEKNYISLKHRIL